MRFDNLDYLFIALLVISPVLILYLLVKDLVTNNKLVIEFIEMYFEDSEFKIIQISGLNIKEKIKYATPSIPSMSFVSFFPFNFLTEKNNKYFRKVETVDNRYGEQIRYIEIVLNNGNLVSINEFDVYEY